jgi:hypothetical protein
MVPNAGKRENPLFKIIALVLERCSVQISTGTPYILPVFFCGFPLSFQVNVMIVCVLGHDPFLPHTFSVHLLFYLPKRRLTFNGLHGSISQKIVLDIITRVSTSNPIQFLSAVLDYYKGCSSET